jgi:hypothetical protein
VGPELEATYRVIGVRDDGTRVQIDDSLTAERANDIHRRLTVSGAFVGVVVEQEPAKTKEHRTSFENSNDDSVIFDGDDTKK